MQAQQKSCLLLVLCLVLSGLQDATGESLSEYCLSKCTHQQTWGPPATVVYQSPLDNSIHVQNLTWGSLFQPWIGCVYKSAASYDMDVLPLFGGPSPVCPNDCSSSSRGECTAKGCACSAGYTGPDCVSVSCGQNQRCSDAGTCATYSSSSTDKSITIDYCQCRAGKSGLDCSETFETLPTVPLLAGTPQYSPKDKTQGNDSPVFDVNSLSVLHVYMSDEDLNTLMNPLNLADKDYMPATLVFQNGKVDPPAEFQGVGIRTKGGASRGFMKKSWRINLKKFNKAGFESFYGQDTLLLKATAMTPDWVRERLSRNMLYAMGVPVQRMSYADVFINGVYRGVYHLMENVDDAFLKARFGNAKGALWKCGLSNDADGGFLKPNFAYQGEECSSYTGYDPKTTLAEQNCSQLIRLTKVLANSSTLPDFEAQLEAVFDVDGFLRALAAEIASGNWDGIWNNNNFYLYQDADDARIRYFRQDLDLAFGGSIAASMSPGFNKFFREGDVFQWGLSTLPVQWAGENVLLTAVMKRPRYAALLGQHLSTLIASYFDTPVFNQTATILHKSVWNSRQQDYWGTIDQGYTFGEYVNNLAIADVIRPSWLVPGLQGNQMFDQMISEWSAIRIHTARQQIAAALRNN